MELIDQLFSFTMEPFELDSDLFSQLMNCYHNRLIVQNEPFEIDFYLLSKFLSSYYNRLSS